MPTNLPVRSRDSHFGRKRGLSRSVAALLLWAMAMMTITAASHAGNAVAPDTIDVVLQ